MAGCYWYCGLPGEHLGGDEIMFQRSMKARSGETLRRDAIATLDFPDVSGSKRHAENDQQVSASNGLSKDAVRRHVRT